MPDEARTQEHPCPPAVLELVERFTLHRDTYRQPTYNETQVRREFIDPLFEALGWDIDNVQGHADAYKDVIHEDAIRFGGSTKAPDYCFRVGGVRKFLVEAKKPAEDLRQHQEHAYQLRRYAWTAKLPVSILTDFEEFAVYDCTKRPGPTDKAFTGRVLYLTCDEFAERWGDIASIFSKDAILKGAFDKFAESNKRKRGTAEVDDEFLKEIEGWRQELARNVALRNPNLSIYDLNYAVTRTIDRIIFLRMCEDRGVETYAQLRILLNGTGVYPRMLELFYAADDRYNSGLFHFRPAKDRPEAPDGLTPALAIDDKVLKDIIKRLYYPDCPYEFSVMPPEVLGQVYEQFLGKVITLTAGHRAKIELKPEVRKAGGVYYTPKYIVDYIVEHTVGTLLDGKTPADLGPMLDGQPGRQRRRVATTGRDRFEPSRDREKATSTLRILDPACGSGSFLLGAYQHLLDWHLKWYAENEPQTWARRKYPPICQTTRPKSTHDRPAWRLTIAERKRILLNNIYGVDIDLQAVEVTKLSLLLKVLEGETQETLENQLRLFHERALPDLWHNVKCGNSLIGPDFYNNHQMNMFDEEDRYRINAFDWNREFPQIMKVGGFDSVIGNPPWGQKEIEKNAMLNLYLRDRFPSVTGIFDMFRPFVEKGVALALKGGRFGMVLPDIVLLKNYTDTRRLLLEQLSLERIDWWGMAFREAVIDACTIVGRKSVAADDHAVCVTVHDAERSIRHDIQQRVFWRNDRLTFNLYLTAQSRALLDKLRQCPMLSDFFEIHEGVHSGNVRARLFVDRVVDASCKELYFGRDEIAPYFLRWNGKFVRLSVVPTHKKKTAYANAGRAEWYTQDKLLIRRTGDFVLAAVDRSHRYASNNFFVAFPKLNCALNLDGVCALLNSTLMTWYFRTIEPRTGRVFAELKIKHLSVFPVPSGLEAERRFSRLSELGAARAKAGARLDGARTPTAKTAIQREIDATDRRIDQLVNQLYGLTDDEIPMVEDATVTPTP